MCDVSAWMYESYEVIYNLLNFIFFFSNMIKDLLMSATGKWATFCCYERVLTISGRWCQFGKARTTITLALLFFVFWGFFLNTDMNYN